MGEKELQYIRFPGLPDKYTIPGMSNDVKLALLACFRNVAWLNWEENNKSYYDKLAEALGVDPSDIPTPSINKLIMEVGDIDVSTGVNNDNQPKRIRLKDYFPMTSGSHTISGCPFATSWAALAPNDSDNSKTNAVMGIRYYNSSKTILGTINLMENPTNHVFNGNFTLPSNTEYIRFIIQISTTNPFSAGFSESAIYPLVIDGVEYYIREV